MRSRLRTIWRRLRHRLLSLLVLLGVCASILPLPIPSAQPAEKDRSQPFPCQNRPCGCRTAEQCWKKCCCFSNAEKLTWAQANQVIAPDYVQVAAAAESKSSVCRKPCCERKNTPDLCRRSPDHLDEPRKCEACARSVVKVESETRIDYVLAFVADQCRGQSSFFNAIPWAVLPTVITFDFHSVSETVSVAVSVTLPQITYQPPAPPPRHSAPLSVI